MQWRAQTEGREGAGGSRVQRRLSVDGASEATRGAEAVTQLTEMRPAPESRDGRPVDIITVFDCMC